MCVQGARAGLCMLPIPFRNAEQKKDEVKEKENGENTQYKRKNEYELSTWMLKSKVLIK